MSNAVMILQVCMKARHPEPLPPLTLLWHLVPVLLFPTVSLATDCLIIK